MAPWLLCLYMVLMYRCVDSFVAHRGCLRARREFGVQAAPRVPARKAIFSPKPSRTRNPAISDDKSRVQRSVNISDRIPFEDLHPGQKLRGKVISIAKYGMFVDVGTKKDGLVHVKDVSDQSFVQNLERMFLPGQDVDVWVKFVLPKEKKLGLQMYPPKVDVSASPDAALPSERSLSLANLQVGMEVRGKVIRATDYGLYVDIGASDVTPFLHRRKMKSNRRQRKYTASQLVPLGSEVTCLVHEIDEVRSRVSLTTYPQELWEERLLPSVAKLTRGVDSGYDSDRAPGAIAGDLRSRMARRLRGSARFGEDGEDFEDSIPDASLGETEDDDDDDEGGEVLSAAEIRRLTSGRRDRGTARLVDDYDGANARGGSRMEEAGEGADEYGLGEGLQKPLREDQYSIPELFERLAGSRRKPYLTLSDLKHWQYVQVLMEDGMLTLPQLKAIFYNAGAQRGQLRLPEFAQFLDLFAEEMGLQDSDEQGNGGGPGGGQAGSPQFLIDDIAEGTSPASVESGSRVGLPISAQLESPEMLPAKETGVLRALSQAGSSTAGTVSSNSLLPAAEGVAATNRIADTIFSGLAPKNAPYVDFDTVLRKWSVVRSIVAGDSAQEGKLRHLFAQSAGRNGAPDGMVDGEGFAAFFEHTMRAVQDRLPGSTVETDDTAGPSTDDNVETQPVATYTRPPVVGIDWEGAFLDLYEYQSKFEEKKWQVVNHTELHAWPPIQLLLQGGVLTEALFDELFLEASDYNFGCLKGRTSFPEIDYSKGSLNQTEFEWFLRMPEKGVQPDPRLRAAPGRPASAVVLDFDGFLAFAELLTAAAGWQDDIRSVVVPVEAREASTAVLQKLLTHYPMYAPKDCQYPIYKASPNGAFSGPGGSDKDPMSEAESEARGRRPLGPDWPAVFMGLIENCLFPQDTWLVANYTTLRSWEPVAKNIQGGVFSEARLREMVLEASRHNFGAQAVREDMAEYDANKDYLVRSAHYPQIRQSYSTAQPDPRLHVTLGQSAESVVLDFDGFLAFMDLFGQEICREGDNDVDGESSPPQQEDAPLSAVGSVQGSAATAGSSDALRLETGTGDVADAHERGIPGELLGEPDGVAEEADEGEVTRKAFLSISRGKPHVSFKDLLNWDFVLILLAEGVLTEDELRELVKQHSEGNRKGLALEGFDRLVDALVVRYRDAEVDDAAGRATQGEEGVGARPGEAAAADEDSDPTEVDTESAFLQLSAGRGYVTAEDLASCDLLKGITEDTDMNAEEWNRVLDAAGVRKRGRISLQEFDAVFDALLERAGYCDADDCNDPSHEH